MSEPEDVFKFLEERIPCVPQLRIYLLSDAVLPIASLFSSLSDHELFLPHSKNEVALIRKMAVESEQDFRREVERVTQILAPLLIADSILTCMYDDGDGRTQFFMQMRKTGGMPDFIEMDTAPPGAPPLL